MDAKTLTRNKLSEFANRSSHLVDRLSSASKEHGPDSEKGRGDSLSEHWVLNRINRIYAHLNNESELKDLLIYLLENSQKSPRLSKLDEGGEKLLLDFFDCIQEIADSLGLKYTLPHGPRLSMSASSRSAPEL